MFLGVSRCASLVSVTGAVSVSWIWQKSQEIFCPEDFFVTTGKVVFIFYCHHHHHHQNLVQMFPRVGRCDSKVRITGSMSVLGIQLKSKQKIFSGEFLHSYRLDFAEIWHTCSSRWVVLPPRLALPYGGQLGCLYGGGIQSTSWVVFTWFSAY